MIKINNIKIFEDLADLDIIQKVILKYKIKQDDVINSKIFKKSIDARNKSNVHYLYSVELLLKNEISYLHLKSKDVIFYEKKVFPDIKVNKIFKNKPVIIGAGPSGLFAAITLVEHGIKPIIIEQGKTASERKKDVELFLKKGKLNHSSNVHFGEGGAGTFSDGKLTTGINTPYYDFVLQTFVKFGAPSEILRLTKPHIGTDNLIHIVENMRKYIISLGGEFMFDEKVTDFEIRDNKVVSISCSKKIYTDNVILAIGHSSYETFEKLLERGVYMEPKNFSIGVRIEHKQEDINISQYGKNTKLNLPSAEYKLACHLPSGRSVYTFCMCPGGVVIGSSSSENTVITNGMSNYDRNLENANSALLVNVTTSDFSGSSPLAGLYFQKDLEQKAFELGGSNYFAPIQLVGDFLNNTKSVGIKSIKPTYLPGVALSNLHDILPAYISNSLQEAIKIFDTKIKGFANPDSVLTGLETRSSSPVKIPRDENCVSNISGIYPCGEGSGYAGGITSAAVDGIKCAISLIK